MPVMRHKTTKLSGVDELPTLRTAAMRFAEAPAAAETVCVTVRPIGAVKIQSPANQTGVFCRLGAGLELRLAGPGVDYRTYVARCGGEWYLVFKADIHLMRLPAETYCNERVRAA